LWIKERGEWVAITYERWQNNKEYEVEYGGPYEPGSFCEQKIIEAYKLNWPSSVPKGVRLTDPKEFILEIIKHAVANKSPDVSMSNMGIESLPKEIGQLEHTKILDLGHNSLSSLPSEFWKLRNLEKLTLRNNKLKRMPSELRNLSGLKFLSLSNNDLSTLPKSIGDLTYLEDLQVTNNSISVIPKEISQLRNLKSLHLGRNQINTLPPELKKLKTLDELYLLGNKLTIPPEILDKWMEPQTILNYYFSLVNTSSTEIKNVAGIATVKDYAVRNLNEVKL